MIFIIALLLSAPVYAEDIKIEATVTTREVVVVSTENPNVVVE